MVVANTPTIHLVVIQVHKLLYSIITCRCILLSFNSCNVIRLKLALEPLTHYFIVLRHHFSNNTSSTWAASQCKQHRCSAPLSLNVIKECVRIYYAHKTFTQCYNALGLCALCMHTHVLVYTHISYIEHSSLLAFSP